ncbi:MAG: SIR2 family protein [Silvibacterium sp.]
MDELEKIYIPHLRAQFERGRPVLFTGAGFSMAAKNIDGRSLPSGAMLKKALWPICFPDEEFDPDSSLQDIFDSALRRAKGKLSEVLLRTFTVAEDGIPEWYSQVFSLPWQRAYTLNIDDLDEVVEREFNLPRGIRSNSVLKAEGGRSHSLAHLEVMHLSGSLDEVPDGVTFSPTQYAQRLASPDPIYRRLAAELLTSPFVFIGSVLEEPTLWQSIEVRRLKGGRDQRELRPRSYLVNPTLSPAKRPLLAEFNVVWLAMTAEEFSERVLSKLGDSATEGLRFLFSPRWQLFKA